MHNTQCVCTYLWVAIIVKRILYKSRSHSVHWLLYRTRTSPGIALLFFHAVADGRAARAGEKRHGLPRAGPVRVYYRYELTCHSCADGTRVTVRGRTNHIVMHVPRAHFTPYAVDSAPVQDSRAIFEKRTIVLFVGTAVSRETSFRRSVA